MLGSVLWLVVALNGAGVLFLAASGVRPLTGRALADLDLNHSAGNLQGHPFLVIFSSLSIDTWSHVAIRGCILVLACCSPSHPVLFLV